MKPVTKDFTYNFATIKNYIQTLKFNIHVKES